MSEERKQHLELVAASLTHAYYSEHTAASRDYRELLDTYDYILTALIEKDSLPPGQSPLRASDSLSTPKPTIRKLSQTHLSLRTHPARFVQTGEARRSSAGR